MFRALSALCIIWLLTGLSARADEVTLQSFQSVEHLQPGQPFELAVVVDIQKPWHVNAHPATAGFIPTTLTIDAPAGVEFGPIRYPAGEALKVGWSDEPVMLYSGKLVIRVAGRVDPQATVGPRVITGQLRYQACDDTVCLAPIDLPVKWETAIAPEPANAQHPEVFGVEGEPLDPARGLRRPREPSENSVGAARGDPPSPAASDGQAARPPVATNSIERMIGERGWVLALVFLFLGGMALNLTPCVYPMIAITVSYFGGQGDRKFASALGHSLLYCLGIVLTYSVLGLAAALTGGLFGALLQSPVVLIGIALLMVALALSMFGLYELRPPAFLVQKAAGMSNQAGYVGVFLLGATVGVIAAPCLAPILVALLAYVSQRGDPWLGWWLFFTLALGLGAPYVVLGTFSGLLAALPKSGTWMVNVKRVFGVLLIGVAIWFVLPLVRPAGSGASPIGWQPYRAELVAQPSQPVLIDFYADWCIPCHEMDKRTFTDPRIVAQSKGFLMLKADLTRTGSPEVNALAERYKIVGVPTFVFIGPDGQERGQLRQVGFVPADQFLKVMERAQTAPASAATTGLPDVPPQLLNPF